jgi:arylsulfatase
MANEAVNQEQETDNQQERNTGSSNHEQPMNIVFFYADDWTMKTLGMLNPHVRTPNLDKMAKRGMLFRNNCVTTSICWQSRSTMMTSMYVAVHQQLRIWDDNMFNKTVPWMDTLYPQLKSNGYHVGFIGKWHHPMPEEYRQDTFDYFSDYYGDHWMERNGRRRHVTELNGNDALYYLRKLRPRHEKFALTISFFATHADDSMPYPLQYSPMPYTASYYVNKTIPIPKTATDKHWNDMPWFFTDGNEGRVRWRQRYDSPTHYQTTMKRYYRMATEVDDVIGAVIQELKVQGIYNHTYLIFTTDNGNFHGEHGLADKWYPQQESIQVPLIIQDPRMPREFRGSINDDFTLNLDLAPTLLSAAGIHAVPKHMQGRDIAQLYLNAEQAKASWRQDFFYEWSQGRPEDAKGHGHYTFIPAVFALVQKDYKYFYWPQTKYEQVFNVAADPFEEEDIFNATAQTDPMKLAELKARYLYLKTLSQGGHPV